MGTILKENWKTDLFAPLIEYGVMYFADEGLTIDSWVREKAGGWVSLNKFVSI